MKGIFFFLVLSFSVGLFAQKGPLTKRLEDAQKLYEAENYEAYKAEIFSLLGHPRAKQEAGLYRKLLIEAGYVLIDFVAFEEAFDYYEQALAYQEKGRDIHDSTLATIYNDMGYIRGRQSKFQEQLALYQKALEYRLKIYGENHPETARSYNNIGSCYGRMRQYDQQLIYFKKALAIRLETLGESHEQTALSYNNLGFCYGRLGDYDQELAYYLKALQLRKEIYGENHSIVARTLGNIGFHYHNIGQSDKAIGFFEESYRIYSGIFGPNHPEGARMQENIGTAYGRLGYLDKCLLYLNDALEVDQKYFGEESEEVVQNVNNQAVFSFELGEYAQAVSLFQRSLDISKSLWGEKSKMVVNRMSKLAVAHFYLGNYPQSLQIYNEALAIDLQIDSEPHYDQAEIYYRKGMLYLKLDSLEKAQKNLWEAKRQFAILEEVDRMSTTYQGMASYFQRKNSFDSALYHYNLAIQMLIPSFSWKKLYENPEKESLLSDNILMDALIGKGEALMAYGKFSAKEKYLEYALETFPLAIEIIEKRRVERGEKTRQKLGADIRQVFSLIIQAAGQLYEQSEDAGYKQIAFEAMESSRAYALREQIHLEQLDAFADLPDSLLQQDRALKQELVFYQNKIKDEQAKRNDSAKISLWRSLLVEKQLKRDQLLEKLSQNYPRYFALKHSLPGISLSQSALDLAKRNSCLLSYFRADSQLYALILSSKGSQLASLPLPSDFDDLLQAYLNELRQPDLQADPLAAYGRFCRSSHQLYQLLIAPVRDFLPEGKKLIIIPDGKLGYIPFECLIEQLPAEADKVDYARLPYLLKSFEIGYSYHIRYPEQRESDKKMRYLAFAPAFGSHLKGDSLRQRLPALRYAQEEIAALAHYFEGQSYEQEQATELAFKEQASFFPLLHLATHSWVSDGEKGSSYLLFSGSKDSLEDGRLHSYELYNMRLSADMAVLSACNTGVGQLQEGEGIMSMAHAFAYAGCPSILMSLWQVNDHTTAQLIGQFYEQIADHQSKSAALQKAKLDFLRTADPLKSHPYYWAGMVSIGDQSPLGEKGINGYMIAAIVLLLGLIWWRFFRRRAKK